MFSIYIQNTFCYNMVEILLYLCVIVLLNIKLTQTPSSINPLINKENSIIQLEYSGV